MNEKMNETTYEAPIVEVVEVQVEQGFQASGDGEPTDYRWGGGL